MPGSSTRRGKREGRVRPQTASEKPLELATHRLGAKSGDVTKCEPEEPVPGELRETPSLLVKDQVGADGWQERPPQTSLSGCSPAAAEAAGACSGSPLTGQCDPAEPAEAALGPTGHELDPDWVSEEARLRAETEREEQRMRREVRLRNEHELREVRYKRLLRLLNTSQFYVNHLVTKIDEQHEKLNATLAKSAARSRKRPAAEGAPETVRRSSRAGAGNKENVSVEPATKRPAPARRGRPRKAARTDDGGSSSSQPSSQEEPQGQEQEPPRQADAEPTEDGGQPRLLSGGTLRDYQLEGYNWLKVMFENGVNCILGDEMGLGKTIQCISLIAYLVEQSVVGPFLVSAPLSTLPNWLSEFRRFCPALPVVLYHGPDRERLLAEIGRFHRVDGCRVPVHPVVLTTYEMVIRDSRKLSRFQWRYLIIDEGQRIKNHECQLVRELRRYSSVNRLLLTGTPLQNNLAELWSLLNFLLPEIFDDLAVFESWFDVGSMATDEDDAKIVEQEREKQVVSTLHKILTPFLLRRVKRDVELRIPPKREVLVYCPMVDDQERLYRAAVDRSIAKLIGERNGDDEDEPVELDGRGRPRRSCKGDISFEFLFSDGADVLEDESRWEAGLQLLEESRAGVPRSKKPKHMRIHLPMRSMMMLMRHLVNHPFLVEHPIDPETKEYRLVPELVEKSGKLMVLDAMVTRLRAAGHKILIFSQFVIMLDILADFLTLRGHAFARLDGADSIATRQKSIDAFSSDPDLGVFIISTRAGGLGINLSDADTVIIYDSDWNPQRDLQAQDRAHRIGQTRPVVVYRLVTGGTIDERIVERAAAKRKLEKMVMHTDKFKSGRREQVNSSLAPITPEELLALLRQQQHQRVVRAGGQVFSEEELDQLLDRSDMLQAWSGQKAELKRRETTGVFKVLEEVQGTL
ncbi:lymphocyte-specific helicase-like [Pollicipes pollicipes]|uniref:lymphocyte-specific helicase-like n=1 Tax=Pollicipes pollicipes TaxID=41117 RepID=UPI0018851913|nr:lymphocyte-specific helicase-like [Pollicipes pollicipes]